MIGWLISLFTFPGVALHEFAHKKFCDWNHVEVFSVSYFRIGNPVGRVTHAIPQKYHQVFWISVGPLIINTGVAVLTAHLGFHSDTTLPWRIFFIWIAFSTGANAFPSDQDTENILSASKTRMTFFDFITLAFVFRYLSSLFVFPIRSANHARHFWFWYSCILIFLGYLL